MDKASHARQDHSHPKIQGAPAVLAVGLANRLRMIGEQSLDVHAGMLVEWQGYRIAKNWRFGPYRAILFLNFIRKRN